MSTAAAAPSRFASTSRWTLVFLLFSALAVGFVGWGTYTFQERLSRRSAQEQLTLVAVLKADQIRSWLEFQRVAALGVSRGTVMSLELEAWFKTGKASEEIQARWLRRRVRDSARDSAAARPRTSCRRSRRRRRSRTPRPVAPVGRCRPGTAG